MNASLAVAAGLLLTVATPVDGAGGGGAEPAGSASLVGDNEHLRMAWVGAMLGDRTLTDASLCDERTAACTNLRGKNITFTTLWSAKFWAIEDTDLWGRYSCYCAVMPGVVLMGAYEPFPAPGSQGQTFRLLGGGTLQP